MRREQDAEREHTGLSENERMMIEHRAKVNARRQAQEALRLERELKAERDRDAKVIRSRGAFWLWFGEVSKGG